MDKKKKKIGTALITFFIKDLQPFSVVEDTGLKEFVNMLNNKILICLICFFFDLIC